MVQTLEEIKGGGGSIKIGTTGTISALMSRELHNSSPKEPKTAISEPKEATIGTSLKASVQADEASSSNTTNTTEKTKIPHKTRKNPNRRKSSYIVEVVDIKCKMPDPITNRLKKLNFSKLPETKR